MTLDIIIAGGGRVGFEAVTLLSDRGHNITVVESDGERCDELADEYVATVIRGDAANPDILRQADVARSDVIAGLTGDPGSNLAICMAAAEMNPEIRTVARIAERGQEDYEQFVDETVFPEEAGARVAVNEIESLAVRTLVDVTGALDIMEVEVQEGASAAGKKLESVRFPAGTLVISDDDGERVARPETTLTPGKRYVIAAEPDVVEEVLNLLQG